MECCGISENWRPRAQDVAEWLAPGQVFGPQNPGQKPPVPLPYTNQGANLGKNKPEHIKKDSGHLMYPLQQVASEREKKERGTRKREGWREPCAADCACGVLEGMQEMADLETIDISDDSVVVLKHHGSYMQQNRDLQRTDKQGYAQSFQVHTHHHTHARAHTHSPLPHYAACATQSRMVKGLAFKFSFHCFGDLGVPLGLKLD